jgi:hypothetical protein
MRHLRIAGLSILCGGLAAGMLFTDCAPGNKKLEQAEAQITQLSQQGVPDSILSSARVFLSEVRNSKRLGNGGLAQTNADSLFATLKRAQAWLTTTTTTVKPYIDSVKKVLTEEKKKLGGLQLKEADSLLGAIDAQVAKNMLPEAKAKILEVAAYMPTLIADEQKSADFRKMLVGTWRGEFEPEKKGMTAVKKQVINIKKDSSFTMDEAMKGQSSEYLKEDWEFQSNGKWDVKGDTLLLSVLHEKCVRQEYQRLKDNKWLTDKMKTYDTTITNGSKDQFMVKSFMMENFKK